MFRHVLALELNSTKIKAEWNLAQDIIPKRRWDVWKIQEENLEHVTKVECQHTHDPLWYDFPWSPHSVQRVFLEVLTFLGWSRLVGLFRFRESMPQPPNDYSDRPLGRPFFWGIYPSLSTGFRNKPLWAVIGSNVTLSLDGWRWSKGWQFIFLQHLWSPGLGNRYPK